MVRLGLIGLAGAVGLAVSIALAEGVRLDRPLVNLPSFVMGQDEDVSGRLYGKVLTMDGRELVGFLRWDTNEGSWADLLEADKAFSPDLGAHRKRKDVRLFGVGIRIGTSSQRVQSGIRFGHIERIEVLDDDAALIVTKTGEEIEFDADGTDIGESLRSLIVLGADGALAELRWSDIDIVEFMPAPARTAEPESTRLFGTLTASSGREFTGYVTWDIDEIYTTDVLDGEDGRVEVEVPFGEIASIARNSSRDARVTLTNGEELVLGGTNDVDGSNRGISVSDPALGQVLVDWSDFESVRFHAAERQAPYNAFDGGRQLRGVVTDGDGNSFEGFVRWDNDEAYSWEMLNGHEDGVEFHVELGNVVRITKASSQSVEIELRDGRTYRLRDSNDVNSGNRGVFVTSEGGEIVAIDWRDFAEVRFR